MTSEFVEQEIKGLGVAGAIIMVLMGVISVLSGVIVIMYRHSNKVYGYRLAERDTLTNALNDSKVVLKEMIEATKDRNDVTEDLAEIIAKQSNAFTSLELTVLHHYEMIKDHNDRLTMVVASIPEAIRTLSGITTDMRHIVSNVGADVRNVLSVSTASTLAEVRALIAQAVDAVRRRGKT